MQLPNRRLFVAGASGATGRVVVRQARARSIPLVAHYRSTRGAGEPLPPDARVFDLSDAAALQEAMRGCTTVLQLIGTMRDRFSRGDTYEASDIRTTEQLVAAARKVGVDHVILLSSVGAGKPRGAYLKAKARAEAIVRDSSIPFTVFRPSFLAGEDRRPPPGAFAVTRLLGLKAFEPIRLEDLSAAMLHSALERAPLGAFLEGKMLFAEVEQAKAARPLTRAG